MKHRPFVIAVLSILVLLIATAAPSAGLVMPRLQRPPRNTPRSVRAQPIRFAAPVRYAVGDAPAAVVIGDFNRKSIPDLAVANEGSNTVSILHGTTKGLFTETTRVPVGLGPVGLAAFGFETFGGPGYPENLAVANNRSNNVTVLHGPDTSGFSREPTLATPGRPRAVNVTPIYMSPDEDSEIDQPTLIVAKETSSAISLFTSNATGHFSTEDSVSPVGVGHWPSGIVAQNVWDAPGEYGDVLVTNAGPGTMSVLRNRGTSMRRFDLRVGTRPTCITRAYIGGSLLDPMPDMEDSVVLVGNRDSDNVSVFRMDWEGRLSREPTVTAGDGPVSIAVHDFDGDGCGDMAVANRNSGTLSILRGNGSGHFTHARTITGLSAPSCIVAADFDGDGRPDLAVTEAGADRVSIYSNATRFITWLFLATDPSVATYPQQWPVACLLAAGNGYSPMGEEPMDPILSGRTDVQIWAKTPFDITFNNVGTAAPSSYFYETSITARANAQVIAQFPGDAAYLPAMSNDVAMSVRALLSKPAVPATVPRGRNFAVRGSVRPVHDLRFTSSGPQPTRLYFYRWVNRRYRLHKVVPTTGPKSGEAAYTATCALRYKGYWCVKAYHGDTSHVAGWSPPRYFVVR